MEMENGMDQINKAGFVNIIGNPNVGKSTLMNALVGEKLSIVTAKAQTTRHRIMGIVNGEDYQIVFSDTPGILKPNYMLQESMMDFVETAIGDADIILYVTDVIEKMDKNMEYIEKLNKVECPVIIAINKIDETKQEKVTGVRIREVITGKEETESADKIVIATGGKSYPSTGSTGDGYELAQQLGHSITPIRGSLVPLTVHDVKVCKNLQGLSLRNVKIKLLDKKNNKQIYEDFGEMLFTHFGVSGPIVLSSSAHLLRYKNVEELLETRSIALQIDLKPALTEEKLDLRILRDFEKNKNKQFKNALDELLPKKIIETVIEQSKINPNKTINEITKLERKSLIRVLKNFEIMISGFRDIKEAIVTSGGISIKEINPKTMESKLINGLFFAGEVIDVDAYTGGFNLQIAYSTGYTSGMN